LNCQRRPASWIGEGASVKGSAGSILSGRCASSPFSRSQDANPVPSWTGRNRTPRRTRVSTPRATRVTRGCPLRGRSLHLPIPFPFRSRPG